MVERRGLFGFFLMAVVLVGILFVSAGVIVKPIRGGNYSATMPVNVTTTLPHAMNVTIYYNASGGATGVANGVVLVVIANTSASQTTFYNGSVVISSLADSAIYNITAVVYNLTGSSEMSSNNSITIDNTPPQVFLSNFTTNTVNYANLSGNVTANITGLIDVTSLAPGIDTVIFNVTNSAGTEVARLNASRMGATASNYSWNSSFDTGVLSDGTYNITAIVNDTAGNVNKSTSIQVAVDNVAPTVTLASSSSTKTSVVFTVSVGGAQSGVNGACTVDSSVAVVTGGGTTSQTITDSDGLSCGTSRTYSVTCTTYTSKSATTAGTFSTSACSTDGSSGGGGGSTTTSTWTNTYIIDDTQLTLGYAKELPAKNRIQFKVGTETHSVGVKSISGNSVVIEVASTPQTVTMNVGDEKKFDVDSDGIYDVLVKVVSVSDGKANVSITKISEAVPSGLEPEAGANGEEGLGVQPAGESATTNLTPWIIVLVIVVVIVIIFFAVKGRKK